MPLSADQRAEINRRNAQKSTGPVTDEGKARSRRNALKHGLRAEVLALPDEDPEAVAARAEVWNDYYQPASPAAQHLVNQCVQATLLADRVHRYHAAALTAQVREAGADWDDARADDREALFLLMRTDPAAAVRKLRRTGLGCGALIARWERLADLLRAQGYWSSPDRDEAIRLLGNRPELEHQKAEPAAWRTRSACGGPVGGPVAAPFPPGRPPETDRATYSVHYLPDPEKFPGLLAEMIEGELSRLRDEARRLLEATDAPDRAGASARAAILHAGPQAGLFLRYHAEARTAFHRAHGELVKTLARDAEAVRRAPDLAPRPAVTRNRVRSGEGPGAPVSPTKIKAVEPVTDGAGRRVPAAGRKERPTRAVPRGADARAGRGPAVC